jgi:hypothetical protein
MLTTVSNRSAYVLKKELDADLIYHYHGSYVC